jgi:hypothetical protein
MTIRYPLRGIGPSTFLSYSYADQALATELAAGLEARGLRVHKEDETTLLGRPLSEMLGRRIAEREVFLQLLTKTANHPPGYARSSIGQRRVKCNSLDLI